MAAKPPAMMIGIGMAIWLAGCTTTPDAKRAAITGNQFAGLEQAVEAMFAAHPAQPDSAQLGGAQQNRVLPVNPDILEDIGLPHENGVAERSGNTAFAQRYILVYQGCGTECQTYSIINPSDPAARPRIATRHGAIWRKDSRLVIANPPAELVYFGDDPVPQHLLPDCYLLTDQEDFSEIDCAF